MLNTRPTWATSAKKQRLAIQRARTVEFRSSFSLRTVPDWNGVPQTIASAKTAAFFRIWLIGQVPYTANPRWCDAPAWEPCQLIFQIQIQILSFNFFLRSSGEKKRKEINDLGSSTSAALWRRTTATTTCKHLENYILYEFYQYIDSRRTISSYGWYVDIASSFFGNASWLLCCWVHSVGNIFIAGLCICMFNLQI